MSLREDILMHAYKLAKSNDGAPGVDGESFEDIESKGVKEWLNGLGEELRGKTCQPQPVRGRRFRSRVAESGRWESRPCGIEWRKPPGS